MDLSWCCAFLFNRQEYNRSRVQRFSLALDKILELQKSKRDRAAAVISADNSVICNLRREDLELWLSSMSVSKGRSASGQGCG